MRMTDLELQEHSTKAAEQYLKERFDGITDLVRKHDIANSFALGFGAGIRFHEVQPKEKTETEKT